MVAVSVACGLAGALGAVVFRLLIRSAQALFFEGVPGLATVDDHRMKSFRLRTAAVAEEKLDDASQSSLSRNR